MTIRFISTAVLSAFALVSCKKDLEPQESSVPIATAAAAPAPAPAPQPVAQPAAQPNQPQAMTVTPQPAQQQKVAPGMNPPHGQPGHRCDIPVNTPLSQPVKSVKPQIVQQNPSGSQSNDNVTITPAQISSDGKLVPGSTGNNVKVTTSNGPANGAPALLQTPSAETKPGMNPAHGQPGHCCDIAVGQPLPKS